MPRLVLEVDGAPTTAPLGPVTGSATLVASEDTGVRHLQPNQNFGDEAFLRIQALGKNRGIVGFDAQVLSAVLGGALVKARLRLPIAETSIGWGPDRALGAHRMRRSWTEFGATWNCGIDSTPGDLAANCSGATAWNMSGPTDELAWLTPPTGTALISNGQTGTLEFDVTRDVACALAGHSTLDGWLLKKVAESQTGRIELHSRESQQPPALFIEWTDGQGVVVTPTNCDVDAPPGCTPTAPEDTTCNGVDEDCDGLADDDFEITESTCGAGACAASGEVTCVSGQVVDGCAPGTPAAADATCNGVDEDCDGLADEDYMPATTSCGVGACAATGETSCVIGVVLDGCQAGTPGAGDATCDGADDDCDGVADEEYGPRATNCGVGACAATGTTSCVAGNEVDGCVAGFPAALDGTCNGVDDDCDAQVDEDYVPVSTSCGVGACAATGTTSCTLGQLSDSCQPRLPAASDATCDGVDDDCSGVADDDYAPRQTSCGVGACAATGQTRCVAGSEDDTCTPGTPSASDTTCDGGDDDCNGQEDEDYVAVNTSCGVGACLATGTTTCTAGEVNDSCSSGTPAANDSTCNGIDDDCDGATDEDFISVCAGSVLQTCVQGVLESADCSDGNVCNGAETCQDGACTPGVAVLVDDQNPCTDDSCDPVAGVQHVPHEGTECATNGCTMGACDAAGVCQATEMPVPDDGDPCTVTLCDPVTGPRVVHCEPLDESRVTTLFESTDWIYGGSDPIQVGVAPGTIERHRAALLRGEVRDRSGSPLAGVKIQVAGHPELGSTTTQTNGGFDMVVNAGGLLTLNFSASGRLSAQRSLEVDWNEMAHVPPVVLLEPDPIVTEIDMTQTALPFQVATGSLQADEDGEREATLLFPSGTEAVMIGPDGTAQQLSALHVRATEFTVGGSGEYAMPGPLPPTSGYTYAVEFNADEAVVSGARSIEFSQPLIAYVDNFLDFAAGTVVPVGAFDRERRTWVPHQSGIVVDIISVGAAGAAVDVTGDGVADTGAALETHGVTSEELVQLATLKQPGDSIWRFPVPHFTQPYDCNWPFGPPEDATPPPDPDDVPEDSNTPGPETDEPCRKSGSIIECQTMTLRESLPLAGTPYSLEYASNRVRARRDLMQYPVRITGEQVPASLRSVELAVDIDGRHIFQEFPAVPNQHHVFEWDGLDAYGRRVKGQRTAKFRLSYNYDGVYQGGLRFADLPSGPGVSVTGVRTRRIIQINRTWEAQLGSWEVPGFGGWSIDVHHAYDATSRAMYLGSGQRRLAATYPNVFERAATVVSPSTTFGNLHLVGPDGSMYFINDLGWPFRRTPDGGMTRLVEGDLRFADLALAPDGTIFLLEFLRHRVFKLDVDGTLSVFAGTGTAGFSGDGGPAVSAQFNQPRGIDVDAAGSLYIADSLNRRVRRVTPDGIIQTIAGNGSGQASGEFDGVRATQSAVRVPHDVVVAPSGTVYIIDNHNHRLFEVSTDGIINRLLMVTVNVSPLTDGLVYVDGAPARESNVYAPSTAAIGPDGRLFFIGIMYWSTTSRDEGVFVLSDDKRVYRVAGGARLEGVFQPYYRGAPLRGVYLGNRNLEADRTVWQVAPGPDSVYLGRSGIVDKLRAPPPRLSTLLPSDLLVPSEEDGETYLFDATGRHKETRHADTGAVLRQFFYDDRGLLSEIREFDGNSTHIERDSTGKPVAIVAPFGQRTLLAVDPEGYLASVEDPLGAVTALSHTDGGLLESITDARGSEANMQYDTLGRLVQQFRPNGGEQQLNAFGNRSNWRLEFMTAEGVATAYTLERTPKGPVFTSLFADGTSAQTVDDKDGAFWVTTLADGTVSKVREISDARFGLNRPARVTELLLPSGLAYRAEVGRTLSGSTVAQESNPFAFSEEVTNIIVNGDTWREGYTLSSRTRTLRSPESRQVTLREDAFGRVTQYTITGQQAVSYGYDARGRLESITQGPRVTQLSYVNTGGPADGYLESVTNALGQRVSFGRDARGRAVLESYADSSQATLSWDENDNTLTIAPPGRPFYAQSYTSMDEVESTTPPSVAGVDDPTTSFEYDRDGRLTREVRPDGSVIIATYDTAGRPQSISLPTGTVSYSYYPNTTCAGCSPGRLMNVSGPGAVSLDLEYDGALITDTAWSGPVAGELRWTHDANFRIATEVAAGAATSLTMHYGYDRDGLQTCASPTSCTTLGSDALRIAYNAAGQPTTTALGNVNVNNTYTTFGEQSRMDATFNGAGLLALVYDTAANPRDALGRVTQKAETFGGVTTTWAYAYDNRGRLSTVRENGALVNTYTYDDNGNRTSLTTPSGTLESTYDDQDRLMSAGPLAFSYRESGELETKLDTISGALTRYEYDAAGNLLTVELPSGELIAHEIDGQGRRVAKRVDGALVQGLLYRDQLRVAAELDAAGNVVSQFVYEGVNPAPEAMLKGGRIYRLIKDQVGSTRLVVDSSSGEIAQALEYDEFGVVLEDTNPGFQPFGFAGGLYDTDTGLVRFGGRDYDPRVGRWTTKDPAGFGGGINLYAYVGNNPISETDPTGECPWCVAAGVGAVTGAGFDLALQLLQNGGNLGCVDWGSVGTAALTGAALSGLGPSGFLLGRGGQRAARFGYSNTRALLNRGHKRFGWSGPVNGKDVLSYRIGKHHNDLRWTGVPSGANPQRDGAFLGFLGGGINRGANGSCGCE